MQMPHGTQVGEQFRVVPGKVRPAVSLVDVKYSPHRRLCTLKFHYSEFVIKPPISFLPSKRLPRSSAISNGGTPCLFYQYSILWIKTFF